MSNNSQSTKVGTSTKIERDKKGRYKKGTADPANPKNTISPEDFKKACRQYTMEALEVVAHVMRTPTEKTTDRLTAVKILLDRAYGLAPQAITGGETSEGTNQPIQIETIVKLLSK